MHYCMYENRLETPTPERIRRQYTFSGKARSLKTQKNLTFAAYDRIKEMMLDYEIVPGQRLVFIDLANQLGVSRTPVNNALSILAKEGYLDFVPNQGYSVHRLTEEEAEKLYEVREILEMGAVGKAITLMTPGKLQRFEKCKHDIEQSISGWVDRKFFILDTEFHANLVDMCENEYLTERYREICQKIFLRFRVEDLKVERLKEIVKEHDALFEAVCNRDVEKTKELVRRHYERARRNLFAILFGRERSALR